MSANPKVPRKPRRDAKLLGLPEKDRRLVAGWLQSDGWQACLQRIATQLHIECGKSALYAALAFWESEERRDRVRAKALEQIESEAQEKGYTPQQRMAALDRRMAEIFAADDKHEDYQQARYLMIADESARTKAELERLKIAQKDRDQVLASKKFRRETCELFLEWFDKEAAKQIATSGATNAEKIEQLGLAMFGEDWKQ
jgi:hypothetical protein